MNLNKLILICISFTVLVTLSACGNGDSTGDNKKPVSGSKRMNAFVGGYGGTEVFIPVDSANKMISSYLQSVGSGTGMDTSLHSLIFDADSLRAYLSNTDIKHVKVMFAHTLEYIKTKGSGHNVGYEPGALTVVFGGYDAEGNYVFWQTNRVPDHANECPSKCPTVGNASSDIFPTNQ